MLRSLHFAVVLVIVGMSGPNGVPAADSPVDVLLKNGLIVDGTGAAGVRGNVAIHGDRIVGVGQFPVPDAIQVIDCEGLLVVPGFIDLHSHSDHVVTDALLRAGINYLMQGCTTQVTGNCGSGPADVGEFYRELDEKGTGTNIAHLIPQGSVRRLIVGSDQRAATEAEMSKMRDLVRNGMREGAWGMSTGLIYVPSVYASTEELISLSSVVAEHQGIYASHIRGEGSDLLTSVQEAIRIGKEASLPVHISHLKSSGEENWGRLRLATELIDAARKQQRVTADQYPYTASSTSLEATIVPTWARAGGRSALLKRWEDPATATRLNEEIAASLKTKRGGASLFIARYAPQPKWAGKNLVEIAEMEQRPVLDVAVEMLKTSGVSIVNFSMSEDDVRAAMQKSWVGTASDGRNYFPDASKPHPRSYGTFARKIGHYALEEKVLSLEQAVRSATSLPAEILGMTERGTLKSGFFADVVVIDPQSFRDRATFAEPHQYAAGIQHVFVNGQPAVVRGQATGVLAGRTLRSPAYQKPAASSGN